MFNPYQYKKYKAERTNGFASKLEAAVYDVLCLLEANGQIKDLKTQVTVDLVRGAKDVRIRMRVDFSCINCASGKLEYHEAKGFETPEFKLKKRLWKSNPPGVLHLWKGSHKNPKVVELVP